MKQSIILRFYAVFAVTFYLGILIFYFLENQSLFPIWFSLACLLIGYHSLLRGSFFALDSATWLGIFITGVAFIGLWNFLFGLSIGILLCLYSLTLALASFITGWLYKNYLLFEISFLLSLESFLVLVYIINIVSLEVFIIFNVILAGFVVYRIWKSLKVNTKTKNKH